MFSTVTEFLCQSPQIETTRFSELVTEHLMKLEKETDGYFLSLGEDEVAYLKNPFTANAQTLQAGIGMQEELIELQHDGFASTFSVMLGIKSKYLSQLKTPEHDLCCAVANLSPRINELVAKKQVHPSH